ncbi:MAG: carboxymuconolactone decarboxylase family protein [Acidobacteriota bacterium]
MNDESAFERGMRRLREVDGEVGVRAVERLSAISPDLARYIVEFAFGEVYSRPGLDPRYREAAALGALTALGHTRPQLKTHVHAALNAGLSREEIKEILLLMAPYVGFPSALNAMFAAQEVFDRAEGDGEAAP